MKILSRLLNPWFVAGVLSVAGFVVAASYVQPAPPRHLVMATGSEQGAYHAFGKQYRAALAEYGIDLELRPTAGSVENLELLSSGAADLAFAQGGTATDALREEVVGLATLFHEPLWIFHQAALPLQRLNQLEGRRIAVGPVGSGTRAVALALLAANDIDSATADLVELSLEDAADALLAGTLDVGFFVSAASSDTVQHLAESPRLRLLDVTSGVAYERHFRYLQAVLLDQGMIDLATNRQPMAMGMLAPLASLVARKDIHPAVIHLMLEAAREIHGPGGLFDATDEFPTTKGLAFPVDKVAERYFRLGPSFLYRVLPFWAASTADRLKIMLLPLLTLLVPLLRVAPPIYRWRIRSRIYRWYKVVRQIEQRWSRAGSAADHAKTLAELGAIRREVDDVTVPPSYGEEFYNLRMHLARLRTEVEQAAAG